jgi:hypothetical protein
MLKDLAGKPWDGSDLRVQVADDQGALVCALTITGTMARS